MSVRGRSADRDAGTAVMLVLVFATMGMILLLALTSLIRGELLPAAFHSRSATSLRAAQTGVDSATAAIRAAVSTGTLGDLTRLPCAGPASPLTATTSGDGRGTGHRTSIRYYTIDPTSQTQAWRTGNALPCTPGAGPAAVPVYALIEAVGSAPEVGRATGTLGRRAVESVYRFRFTDSATLGGWIQAANGAQVRDHCWTAPSATPAAGAVPSFSTCTEGDVRQAWSYRPDFSIVLTATETAPGAGGMCLDATWSANAPVLSFRVCDGSSRQKWGMEPFGGFQALTASGQALSGWCVSPVSGLTSGQPLQMTKCGGNDRASPQSATGSGGAGLDRGQLVNYGEFGYCLDVAGPNGVKYAVDYPCDQDPTRPVEWDQRFSHDPVSGRIETTDRQGRRICLADSGSAGGYAEPQPCSASAAGQAWTLTGDTGRRSTAFTLVSRSTGRCAGLGPGGKNGPAEVWSAVVMQPCDGSYQQKWNAVPLAVGGTVNGYQDRGNGTSLP